MGSVAIMPTRRSTTTNPSPSPATDPLISPALIFFSSVEEVVGRIAKTFAVTGAGSFPQVHMQFYLQWCTHWNILQTPAPERLLSYICQHINRRSVDRGSHHLPQSEWPNSKTFLVTSRWLALGSGLCTSAALISFKAARRLVQLTTCRGRSNMARGPNHVTATKARFLDNVAKATDWLN